MAPSFDIASVSSAKVRQLHARWEQARGGRLMPARGDMPTANLGIYVRHCRWQALRPGLVVAEIGCGTGTAARNAGVEYPPRQSLPSTEQGHDLGNVR